MKLMNSALYINVKAESTHNTGFWLGNPRERDHLEDPCLDGVIILKWIWRIGIRRDGLDWCGAG